MTFPQQFLSLAIAFFSEPYLLIVVGIGLVLGALLLGGAGIARYRQNGTGLSVGKALPFLGFPILALLLLGVAIALTATHVIDISIMSLVVPLLMLVSGLALGYFITMLVYAIATRGVASPPRMATSIEPSEEA